MKVSAVIVTYNRLELLKRCVAAVQAQTYNINKLYVINNGSTDGTETWLNQRDKILAIHQENLGGAGGFHNGIKKASEDGADWIWCMDDDGYPEKDALEQLMKTPNWGPCIKNSLVLDINNHNELAWELPPYSFSYSKIDQEYIINYIHPFNGTLIAAEVVRQIGLPLKELFIWGDEVEYITRAFVQLIPLVTVVKSIFYHKKGVFSYDKEWENLGAIFYFFRNSRFLYVTKNGSVRGNEYYLKDFFKHLKTIIIHQKKKKLKKIFILLHAYASSFYLGLKCHKSR